MKGVGIVFDEVSRENQQGNQVTHRYFPKERAENVNQDLNEGDLKQEEGSKTQRWFLIPNLVNFLIQIIIIGDMAIDISRHQHQVIAFTYDHTQTTIQVITAVPLV